MEIGTILTIVLIAMAFLLSVSIVFTLISFSFFWYESVNGSHYRKLQSWSRERGFRWVLRALLWGCAAGIVVPLTYQSIRVKRLWSHQPDTTVDKPPVFLIHGLYHNASAWLMIRRWLKKAGYRNVILHAYSSWNTSFQEVAGRCAQEFATWAEVYPDRKFILIGHSLGGLLIREILNDPTLRGRAQAVVTMGTPHQGSKLAALALGRLGQSLIYQGELIGELNNRTAADSDLACLAIYSPVDNMVLPNEAHQIVQSGWQLQRTRPISHVGLLYHRPTFRAIVEFLNRHDQDRGE